MMMSLL